MLLAALALAATVVFHADLPSAWRQLRAVATPERAWLLALAFFAPSGIACWLHTHAWVASFGGGGPALRFGQLFAIRLAGDAVNQVTPLLALGGEPVKAALFRTAGGSAAHGAAAVLAARWMMTLAQVLLVGLAIALAACQGNGSPRLLAGMAVFPAAVGVGMGCFSAAWLLVPRSLRAWVREHPWVRRARPVLATAGYVVNFWRHHPRECAAAFLWSLCAWCIAAAEFWLVGQTLGVPIGWSEALALEGMMTSINMATFFIPGNLGSQEMGLVALSRVFGLGDAFGAVVVVLRRGREVFWIVVGLVLLGVLTGAAAGSHPGTAAEEPPAST